MLQSSTAVLRASDVAPMNGSEPSSGFEGMIGHSAVMREV